MAKKRGLTPFFARHRMELWIKSTAKMGVCPRFFARTWESALL
jgi:hypothetical protein